MSFSMAATTFSGQNYGAGNMERVRKGMRVTVAMGVIYCICVGSILLLFAHPLIGIFSKDPTVIEFGVRAMLYFCPFYFLLAIMHGLAAPSAESENLFRQWSLSCSHSVFTA